MSKTRPQEKFKTGIGRTVDLEWADHFEGIIRSVLPRRVEFKMRESPGLVYVSGDDLHASGIDFEGNNKNQKRQHAEAYAQSLVESLSEGELNKQAALGSLTLPLQEEQKVDMIRRRTGFRIGVRLDDILHPAYPDEYIVQVEREIMEEEFDVPRTIDSTSETVPKHSLHLGFLSGDFERQTIEDAGILLQGHALLSGIGIVEVALIDTRTPLL